MTNKLQVVVQEQGLEEQQSTHLMSQFSGFYGKAREIAKGAKSIVVKDESDVETMELAREKRLELKDLRVEAEKTRKKLKAQSLREGRAIDGIANVIKALVVPLEEHLLSQEKYAERLEVERKDKTEQERVNKLSKYVEETEVYRLHPDEMSNETFEKLLKNSKEAHEARIKAEKQAEQKRLETEQKLKLKRERREKLAPLSRFADLDKLTLETTESEFEGMLKRAETKQDQYEEEQAQIRKENEKLKKQRKKERKVEEAKRKKLEKKLEKERKEREKKEAKERKEREIKEAKERAEREAKEEAECKALLAPDKEKLLDFATRLHATTAPAIKSKQADMILEEAMKNVLKAIDVLQEGAKKL